VALSSIHLCSGYGGFELALRSVARVRTVAHVERDAYAAAVLVERMAQARLDQAPVWDDLTTFDGRPWRGRVDLITAGFPCQPFSSAGQQRGTDDERWLWPAIASIIADLGPRFVLLENVPQLVRLGLPHVLHDLAQLGFDAEWGLLSAAAVGAPHLRTRLWLVGHAGGPRRAAIGRGGDREEGVVRQVGDHLAQHTGEDVDDPDDGGLDGPAVPEPRRLTSVDLSGRSVRLADADADGGARRQSTRDAVGRDGGAANGAGEAEPRRRRGAVADAEDDGLQGGADRRCGSQVAWPPGRDDHDGWARWIAEGGPQPVLRRCTHGPAAGLADALHLGGNGLVPQAAAHAIRQLLDRGGWELR